jgi:hypothetical protein
MNQQMIRCLAAMRSEAAFFFQLFDKAIIDQIFGF